MGAEAMNLASHLRRRASEADQNPTEPQKVVGNYRKGHVRAHGLDVTIENPQGSFRRGVDKGGKPWAVRMANHYGYIRGTTGADGDHVDCYIGPHLKSPKIFVVDQRDADSGDHDEHKCFMGFASRQQVVNAYHKAFSDGRAADRMGHIAEMTPGAFRAWLQHGDTASPIEDHAVEPQIVRTYDVPYLAGAADKGPKVFIDRRVPRKVKIDDKTVDVAKYLAVHERTEHGLMTARKMPYLDAHKIATKAEKKAVEADGVSWAEYEHVMDGFLAHIEHEHPKRPPPDLYLKPYPHDKQELLRKEERLERADGGRIPHMAEGGGLEDAPWVSDTSLPDAPWVVPEAKEGVLSDVVKSAGSGVAKGGMGLLGLPGDIGSLAAAAGEKIGIPESARSVIVNAVKNVPGASAFMGPGTHDIENAVHGDQWLHKPSTTAGQYAQTVGEFSPAIIGGPGSLVSGGAKQIAQTVGRRLLPQVVTPAVASETAGQATQGTAAEPYARVLAGFAAGITPTLISAASAKRAAANLPLAPTPEMLANESLGQEFNVNLSRGQASGDPSAIRFEDMAKRGAYGEQPQQVAAPFFDEQFQGLQTAGQGIGEQVARQGTVAENPNAAGGILNSDLGEQARNARSAQQAAEAAAEREAAAARAGVDDQGNVINEAIRAGRPAIEAPREAGELVGNQVRSAAARARGEYQGLYDTASTLPGQFHAATFEGIGTRIRGDLSNHDNPVIIDDLTTPVASKAINYIDNVSSLRIQNKADPFGAPNPENITAINLRGVDQARKGLNTFMAAAQLPADRRAVGRIIHAFDDKVEHAISNGLFSGDPQALQAIRDARASYSRYRSTFGPQRQGNTPASADDVGNAMRRIVERNATPEEIANMIVGSGAIGNAGTPVRLADRLEQVLGRDSDAWSAVRQAMWQRAQQGRDPTVGITNLANSTLGRRMFSQVERDAMHEHVAGVRGLDQHIANLPSTRSAEQGRASYQDLFGGQNIGGAQAGVFRRIIDGTATPEETANAVFNTIGGNPGNAARLVSSIERIVGHDSETMAAMRQGVWQKLTQNALGKDQPGQQKAQQAIHEFLNGKGATVAARLYTPDELGKMRRYAKLLKATVIPPTARTNSDTAPSLMRAMAEKSANSIAAGLGAVAEAGMHGVGLGTVGGGALGFGVSNMIKKGLARSGEARMAKKVSQSLNYRNQPQVPAPIVPTTGPGWNRGLMNAVLAAGRPYP